METKDEFSNKEVVHGNNMPSFLAQNNVANQVTNQAKEKPAHPNFVNDISAVISKNNSIFHDDHISNMVVREKVHNALELRHIDLFMQPLVTLPQRKIIAYEFFGRLRINPGQYLPAHDYLRVANEEHIISGLDTIFLTNCLRIIKKQQWKKKSPDYYFINIRPFTLRNHDFMNNLVSLLSGDKEIAHMLVFEMHYRDFLLLSPAEKKIINELAKTGCKFSLDHVSDMPVDVNLLNKMHIYFVKMNANILLNEAKTEKGFNQVLLRKQELDSYNINLIVEKIESETDLIELLDYDIKYGQGFLFGKPDFAGVYT